MALPKKGSRKIVVDGKEYRYVVKSSNSLDNGSKLVVQINGLYSSTLFDGGVTPSMVEKFIRNSLTAQAKLNV